MLGVQLGTLAQIGTFVTVLVGVGGLFLKFRGQTFDHANKQVQQYEVTCERLRNDVAALVERITKCEKDCATETKALHEEIFGLRRQQVQEQISLVNTIIRHVDAPELKTLLDAMEKVQTGLKEVQVIQAGEGAGDDGAEGS